MTATIDRSEWSYEVWNSDDELQKSGDLGYGRVSPRTKYDHDRGMERTWAAIVREVVPLRTKYEGKLRFKLFDGDGFIEHEFDVDLPSSSK